MITDGLWSQQWPTGSAYIGADTAPQDFDFVEFVHAADVGRKEAVLKAAGWEVCGVGYTRQTNDRWCAYRQGQWNVILCWCPLVYLRWVAFTELARRCGLTSKVDRIELCKAILEGDERAAMNVVHLSNFNTIAGNIMQEFVNEH